MATAAVFALSAQTESPGVCATGPAAESMAVFVGMAGGDMASFDSVFRQLGCNVHTTSDCALIARPTPAAPCVVVERPVSIVICDADISGAWREISERVSLLPDPPLLIVTSRVADERLWAEALNLGVWDVLAQPLDRVAVTRSITVAWQHWRARRRVWPSEEVMRNPSSGQGLIHAQIRVSSD
jgi:hypothetical protein